MLRESRLREGLSRTRLSVGEERGGVAFQSAVYQSRTVTLVKHVRLRSGLVDHAVETEALYPRAV